VPTPDPHIPNPLTRNPVPVMIYDGECDFCRYWLARWRKRLGDRLDYVPLQDPQIATRFPKITPARFRESVHLVDPAGTVYFGARAVFEALDLGESHWPIQAYRRIPGAAAISELAYRIVARHRRFFFFVTKLFWGRP
jgi:predicted DCC family thiol-disulfide oxidoreductase YuxK